jgi:Endosomal/lysosomal potassium channel TMEM175
VLDLHVPDVKAGLFGALLRQWPTYLGYVTSFLVIGILWLHHHIFTHLGAPRRLFTSRQGHTGAGARPPLDEVGEARRQAGQSSGELAV